MAKAANKVTAPITIEDKTAQGGLCYNGQMSSRPVTVLLVEDDVDMLDGIVDLLESYPSRYQTQVLKASNGREALNIMAQTTPDVIVSDIMMPEMEGFEFLEQVRQKPEWRHIPFVFLSARGKEGDIRRGRLSEADLYLTKPFSATVLADLVQTQLARSFERQERREQALEQLKKNMMQVLNHEFRTPLTYVTAYYDMLESSLNGRNYREHLRGIQAGCLRLTMLVGDLVLLVGLRSGSTAEQFQQKATRIDDVNIILQSAIENKQALAKDRRVEIHFEALEAAAAILAEPSLLQIAFERLLDNSIKFSRPLASQTSPIWVQTELINDELHIRFRDEGLGIPPSMHQQIFDLFVQHNRSLMEQQGTGIGLTIVRGLVELHHGRIELTSEEKKGSTFTVILPVHQDGAAVDRSPQNSHGRVVATVLLVEDELNLLAGLADLLSIHHGRYEIQVLTATNGLEALELMHQTAPDIIVSDIMMPHMDGYQLLKTVRETPQWVHIPFIFVTAKGEKHDQYEGYRLGVEEYVTKPYDTDDMLGLIEKQLDKHFQSQQILRQNFDSLKRNILQLVTPDLLQPLTAVSIHTEKLAHGLEQTHSQEELTTSLREIQEGGIRLNRLIEDLIILAELQTGETAVSYSWQAQPINNFGLSLLEIRQLFSHHQFPYTRVQYNPNQEVAPIFGNNHMLADAVERLLKFMAYQSKKRPNTIVLTSENKVDEVQFVLHSPHPISAEAYNQFLQTLESKEINLMAQPDFAAGLYIIRQYVALHNGRVVGQNSDQHGCTFTITLPIHKSEQLETDTSIG